MNTITQRSTTITEIKLIDGKPAIRFENTPQGAWVVAESEIDAILAHIQREIPNLTRGAMLVAIGVDTASISRCRNGRMPVLESWLLRMQEFSGIPVAELRRVACIEPTIQAHEWARRAA